LLLLWMDQAGKMKPRTFEGFGKPFPSVEN
jgi:hypothetical protein